MLGVNGSGDVLSRRLRESACNTRENETACKSQTPDQFCRSKEAETGAFP
jgi:hypothetical protein